MATGFSKPAIRERPSELPGIREAVDAGDWVIAQREVERRTERIQAMTAAIAVLR